MPYYLAEIRFNRTRGKSKRDKNARKRKLAYLLTSAIAAILILATLFTTSRALSTDETDITEALEHLSDEILALPDEAFENPKSAAGHRGALANKIKATIHQVEARAFDGALNKLENDMKTSIIEWITPAYATDLIALINEIIDLIQETIEPTPDFTLKIHPDTLTMEQGSADTTTITIESLNGFNQLVDLTITSPPLEGITTTLDPSQVTPPPDSVVHSTLTMDVAPTTTPTTCTITVEGANGSLAHSANISLTVISPPPAPDFSLEAYPSALTIHQGNANTSLIAVTSLASFSQPVALNIPSTPITGVTTTLNPPFVIPPANGSAISILTLEITPEAPIGHYNITVEGTSNGLYHNISILLEITEPPAPSYPDFSIAAFPPSLTIQTGASATLNIVITSLRDFSQPVDLSITSALILDVTFTMDSLTVTPHPNDFVTTTLTVAVGTSASPGDYEITIAGVSGTLTHSTEISLTIAIENVPPEIISVLRFPDEPSYVDEVTVLAAIVDLHSGVAEVTTSYSSGDTWQNVTMTLDEGLYNANIPAYAFGATIEYRIHASDKAGNAASSHLYSYDVADPYPPQLGIPTWQPEMPDPDANVTINVTVTEPIEGSGVANATVWYNAVDTWQSTEMIVADGNWTAAIPGQGGDAIVVFYIEAYDQAGNNAMTQTYEYTVRGVPWPLAWLAGIALGVAALTATAIYIVYRRRKKRSTQGLTNLRNSPIVSLYVPAKILTREEPALERDE